MQATHESVRQVVESYLNMEILDPATSFFSQGILDSFEAINLLFELESKFGVKLEVMEFTNNDNFQLDFLVNNIKKKQP